MHSAPSGNLIRRAALRAAARYRRQRTDLGAVQRHLEAGRATAPEVASVEAALVALQSMVSTLSGAKDSLDTKAAIIPAVVGTVIGLVISRSLPIQLPWWTIACGLIAAGSSVVSVGLAIAVLIPRSHGIGESPEELALTTSDDPLQYKSRIVNALALAAIDMVDLVNTKGERLVAAFIAGVVAVVGLLAFGLLGGLH